MGRKIEFTAKKKKALCDALEKGMPLIYAADLVGISRTTVHSHMNPDDPLFDEDFRTQVAISKATAIRGLIALTGKQGGAWKLLKNLAKGEFTDVHKNVHVGEDSEGNQAPIKMIIEDYRSAKQDENEDE